jgi:hypothetical protein
MSDPHLTFGDLQVTEYSPVVTLEDSMKRCCTLAGVAHDYEFQDEINDDCSSLDDFNTDDDTGTWTISGGQLKGVGGGTADTFYIIEHEVDVEPSYVLTFKKTSGGTAAVTLLGQEYIVWFSQSLTAIATLDSSTGQVDEVLDRRPVVLEDDVDISIAVKYQCMNDFETIDWVSISVFQNGRCILGASDFIYVSVGEYERSLAGDFTDEIGFAVWEGQTAYFDDIRIAELHNIREWTSVDPGETVAQGLNRAVGTTPVFYFMRYNGALAAWVPGVRSLDWTVSADRVTRLGSRDGYFTPGRVRMVGAYYEADVWKQALVVQHGRDLFGMENDPNLMTEDEVLAGALDAHRIMREEDDLDSLQIPANPLLEPQDRVEYDGDDFRVMAIQLSLRQVARDRGPAAEMSIETREYLES